MKYLALIHGNEEAWAALAPNERERQMHDYIALSSDPATVGGHELDTVATATTVRVRNGETLVTDGPFAELKDALGGYYVFECDSIDEACRLAARIPAARTGGAVEVRPIRGGEAEAA